MSQIVEVKTGSGGTILMQVRRADEELVPVTSLDGVQTTLEASVADGLQQLARIGEDFVSVLAGLSRHLETAELELGFAVTGKGSLFVVETEAEASLKAKLVFKFPRQPDGPLKADV
jgi:hypothetical protein